MCLLCSESRLNALLMHLLEVSSDVDGGKQRALAVECWMDGGLLAHLNQITYILLHHGSSSTGEQGRQPGLDEQSCRSQVGAVVHSCRLTYLTMLIDVHTQDHLLLGAALQMVGNHTINTILSFMQTNSDLPSRCLVAAGIKDMGRPAENISIPQNIGGQ